MSQNKLEKKKQTEIIQNAALKVFSEKGYSGASLAEIATEASMNPATIYRFFSSKQELFQSLQRPDLDFPDEQEQQMRRRIIQGALQVFSQKGYFAATMDEISETVSLSKPAIYFYYPSKGKLFSAVLENPVGFRMIEASLEQFLSDDHADLETGLIHLAKTYLYLFQNMDSMALLKIVLSAGMCNTEIAAGFTEKIIGRGSETVAVYLHQFCTFDEEKLRFKIQIFFGMLFSWGLVNVILPQKMNLQMTEIELAAKEIVNQFIYGIQASIMDKQKQEELL